ncbi:MAG: cobalt ECF transporter T component CbiQ [Dehalococcoidia bacterium]|nr:cobalt ECF transporter T component CbiQ [Dehalococcoidia bacterium]
MSITLPLGERYLPGGSFLHRLDARTKVAGAFAFVFTATLIPFGRWPAFAAMAALLALITFAARLSPLLVLRRSALALPFLLVALPLLFLKDGDELFSIPLLAWRLEVTDAGAIAVGSILAKALLSVAAAVVLTATTAPLDLLRALRSLGVPRIIVATVLFMYRYIFVIVDEAMRLLRARESRSARAGRGSGGPVTWRAQVLGNMVGSLFLRSYERSERVFAAMTARGFRGEVRSLAAPAMTHADWLALATLGACLIALLTYEMVPR